jgi:hypothetical protein
MRVVVRKYLKVSDVEQDHNGGDVLQSERQLRELMTELFDQFIAESIAPDGRLAEGWQTCEADEIEAYFRGRRWPDLINYFQRWDPCLSSASFLTDVGFALTLPAFLVATLLWPDKLGVGVLMSILLAPECKDEPRSEEEVRWSGLSPEVSAAINERRKQKFAEIQRMLTQRQRAAVGRTLEYLIRQGTALGDPESYRSFTGLTNADSLTAIQRLWGQ